jgi:hypothetical protein
MATERQERALAIISENIRENKTLPKCEILRRAGYSEEVSKKPALVFDAPSFKELLKKRCPDSLRSTIMTQGMLAKKRQYYKDDMGRLRWTHEPDWAARSKFLDMYNKIAGEYAVPDIQVNNNLTLTQILQEKGL